MSATSIGPGRGHRLWSVDLSDPDAAARVGLEAWDAFDGLDAVVNNAGRPMRRPVQQLDLATVDAVMRTNYLSPVARSSLAVLPRMLERDRGVIVNVSSLGGRIGIAHEAAYVASKFALVGLVRGHGHGPVVDRGRGPPDHPGSDRDRDLGPARQRPGPL